MIYLLLAILCSALISLIMRVSEDHVSAKKSMLATNYFICMSLAAGFVGCEEKTLERFALKADNRGRLPPEDGSHHLSGRLFSAGDMRNGQSLVVRALADGRSAAKEADAALRA